MATLLTTIQSITNILFFIPSAIAMAHLLFVVLTKHTASSFFVSVAIESSPINHQPLKTPI